MECFNFRDGLEEDPMSTSLDGRMRFLAEDPKRKARRISCLPLEKVFRDFELSNCWIYPDV